MFRNFRKIILAYDYAIYFVYFVWILCFLLTLIWISEAELVPWFPLSFFVVPNDAEQFRNKYKKIVDNVSNISKELIKRNGKLYMHSLYSQWLIFLTSWHFNVNNSTSMNILSFRVIFERLAGTKPGFPSHWYTYKLDLVFFDF